MKTTFGPAFGLLAAGLNLAAALTYQEKISAFDAEDFVFQLGGPDPDALFDGVRVRSASVAQFPALEGQGLSTILVNIGPCGINQPRVHPRATTMLYMVEGVDLRVGFVEEFGGDGAVVNDLSKGDLSFVPQGLVHYQQNLGCESATILMSLNSDDPGAVVLSSVLFDLPTELLGALLNLDDPALLAMLGSLAVAPALARQQCLLQCGITEGNDDLDDMSLSFGP